MSNRKGSAVRGRIPARRGYIAWLLYFVQRATCKQLVIHASSIQVTLESHVLKGAEEGVTELRVASADNR